MEKTKQNPMSKTILYNKRISGGNTNPDLKLHYTAIVIKTMWHNSRQGDHWNRTQDPEINSHTQRHLKKPKPYNVKKGSIFNKCCYYKMACRRMQIEPYSFPCTKLKSKWVKDLNIKPHTKRKWGTILNSLAQEKIS